MKIFQNLQKAFPISVLTIWLACYSFFSIFVMVFQAYSGSFKSNSGTHLIKKGASIELPTQNAKININTASKYELMQITGIGSVLADRIIQYRQINGGFYSIANLSSVKGLGRKKILNIQSQICFTE